MAKYVLAINDNGQINLGETAAFIQHVGQDEDGQDFQPNRVVELAARFELYDEDGIPLDVAVDGAGNVDLVPKPNADPVSEALLVTRINNILTEAQRTLDADRDQAVEALAEAVGVANTAAADGLNRDVAANVAVATQAVADRFAEVSDFLRIEPFPIIQADLAVVLAALSADFGAAVHGAPPNKGNRRHMELHRQGRAH